jgi:hypothetical protein
MTTTQVEELVLQSIEHEIGGIHVYEVHPALTYGPETSTPLQRGDQLLGSSAVVAEVGGGSAGE